MFIVMLLCDWINQILVGISINPIIVLFQFNPLNAELNPIRHLLALVRARHIVHVSRIRVNGRLLISVVGSKTENRFLTIFYLFF